MGDQARYTGVQLTDMLLISSCVDRHVSIQTVVLIDRFRDTGSELISGFVDGVFINI